jgi:uncharacterized protein YjbI with pentapeptide repeats
METNMIGSKIAEARKRANISQAQLAQRLFISPQAVGKWERGESLPDIITLNRLAEILGTDLNYFSEKFQSLAREAVLPAAPAQPAAEAKANGRGKPIWDMSRGNWVDADFSGLKDLHGKFGSSNMQRCLFVGSDLSGLLLKENQVIRCDFTSSDLRGSHFKSSHMVQNKFSQCNLNGAEFTGSHIVNCNFSGADFTGAMIQSCSLVKNTLKNAIWNRTFFLGSDVVDTVFEGTIEDCSFENCSFARVKFLNSTLHNTFFKNINLKKVRFVDCKADRLTYAFMKSGKADLSGVTIDI